VAWLIIQIVDVGSEPLSLPAWFDTVAILLLAIGFPIAVILAWAFDLTPQGIRSDSEAQQSGVPIQMGGQRLNYLLQALVLIAVVTLLVDQYVFEPQNTTSTLASTVSDGSSDLARRYSIILGPTDIQTGTALNAEIALSPDGRHLVYSVEVGERWQLYLRELDQGTTHVLPGTEGARGPFFSTDSEWIVFRADQRLRRISIRGGVAQSFADIEVRNGTGVSWTPDDSVIFSASTSENLVRLHRTAFGGTFEPFGLDLDDFGSRHSWPHVLPSGNHLLYTISLISDVSAQDGQIALLSLETGESETVIEDAYNARFVPTGHIVFMRSGSLWARPFDPERMEFTGPEVPAIDGIHTNSDSGATAYTFSNEGLLAYLPGTDTSSGSVRSLVWVDRQGREELIPAQPNNYRHPRLSPDQRRLAVSIRERGNEDVWILDLATGVPNRLTFNPAVDHSPLWTPDGERIVFHSARDGGGMFWKAANGSGLVERLTSSEINQYPETFSSDGGQLVFRQDDQSLYVLSMNDQIVQPLIANSYQEHFSAISPDGRWIAYESHENGPGQIYVRPFPNVEGGPWQVSSSAGAEPRWNPQGGEIFYGGEGEGSITVVQVQTEPNFSVGMARPLLPDEYVRGALNQKPNYDIALDGERFLMIKNAEQTGDFVDQTVLTVVDNWFEELNRLAPPSGNE